MPANARTIDLLVEAFDLNQRRKFALKNDNGDVIVDLFFKPITRADRKKASSLAGSDEALDISTQMLCRMAELEDGTKAFAPADAAKLQRQLPESVLNELELFLFGVGEEAELEEAKNE
jgi:hypothetical protein